MIQSKPEETRIPFKDRLLTDVDRKMKTGELSQTFGIFRDAWLETEEYFVPYVKKIRRMGNFKNMTINDKRYARSMLQAYKEAPDTCVCQVIAFQLLLHIIDTIDNDKNFK